MPSDNCKKAAKVTGCVLGGLVVAVASVALAVVCPPLGVVGGVAAGSIALGAAGVFAGGGLAVGGSVAVLYGGAAPNDPQIAVPAAQEVNADNDAAHEGAQQANGALNELIAGHFKNLSDHVDARLDDHIGQQNAHHAQRAEADNRRDRELQRLADEVRRLRGGRPPDEPAPAGGLGGPAAFHFRRRGPRGGDNLDRPLLGNNAQP